MINTWNPDPDQLFYSEPPRRSAARELYDWVAKLLATGPVDEEDAPRWSTSSSTLWPENPTCPKTNS